MTPEVQAHIFEPFFTTRQPGRGTGLGLSTVYGIVQQSHGFITVHSTPGLGTTFRVYFPALENDATTGMSVPSVAVLPAAARGTETVLLVEDNGSVRKYVRDELEEHGYRVLDAGDGAEAIELAERHVGPIHLLLTDIVMPGIKGDEVVRLFHELRPGVPVLRMSGYSPKLGVRLDESIPYLAKPFTAEQLLIRVGEILHGGAADVATA